jgi:hypothetical protein
LSSLALLIGIAGALLIALPSRLLEIAFLACWTSTALTAASVHLPNGLNKVGVVALSLNAGLCSGWVVSLAGSPRDLLIAVPFILLALPAWFLVSRHGAIAIKVASSWLIAIAMLSAALPFLPVTPGYQPDHLE